MIRLQLARPNQHLLTPEQYNQLFTMHGVTMIFLYALPVLSGFSNYLWPLLLGARDMAFPRLNALVLLGVSVRRAFSSMPASPLGQAPNAGWFNYVPLSARAYNPGPNIDVYALGMVLLGISTTVGAVNFIVTLFTMRAPGMSINRVPILVWGTLTASVANLFAVPSVSLAFFLLWMDRNVGTHFFDIADGGQALLWQHLFWMFGHPWVYVDRAARDGHRLRWLADLLPPPAGGLYRRRTFDHGDHADRLRGVGAPHVRHRPAAAGAVASSARRA